MSVRSRPVCAAAILAAAIWHGTVEARFGTITIPACNLMDLEEGTIEAWVRFEFEPAHSSDLRWRGIASLAFIEIPKGDGERGSFLHVGWGQTSATRHGKTRRQTLCRVAFVKEGKQVPHPATVDVTAIGKGQWHHVAVTWSQGRHVRVYLDGKDAGGRELAWPATCDVSSSARLVIGWPRYIHDNAITVDEIRISSVARKPGDLGVHGVPLEPDPFTLLLENFEQVTEAEGERTTKPYRIDGDATPLPIVGGAVVQGKHGRGYAFNPKPNKKDMKR